mmetsp:Transcript_61946/g.191976  ORF Transcript_61946/g.191976 Transcript_61946/m.191976 type:complete len:88 (+) Transcript_61946:144-407(+)
MQSKHARAQASERACGRAGRRVRVRADSPSPPDPAVRLHAGEPRFQRPHRLTAKTFFGHIWGTPTMQVSSLVSQWPKCLQRRSKSLR